MLVHENRPDHLAPDAPNVFLLHGLGSSHAGTYMTNIAVALLGRGSRVFRADLPGAGPSFRTTPLPPHGACFGLVRECLNHLSQTLAIEQWRIAGVSLGGNLLLKMLAETARDPVANPCRFRVASAVSVAPPIDLNACCLNMERGINRVYASYFLRALKKQAQQRAELWPQWQKVLPGVDYSTVRRFDETLTAPLAGFPSADAYYAFGSSANALSYIDVPTTILIDEHDPIVPAHLFDGPQYSATTRLVRTKFGGHVGYLHRPRGLEVESGGSWSRWADHWIADTLACHLSPPISQGDSP
jgi:predicted alpha/beta-fold hydrolase